MKPKSRLAAFCRKCAKPYERTKAHRIAMSATTKGKPRPHLRGKKRPEHAEFMRQYWTCPKRRAAARVRGAVLAANEEWKADIAKKLSGPNNPRWLGGIAYTGYAPGFSRSLKRKIRKRDQYMCQLCAKTEKELGYPLSVHHSDYDKTNHSENYLFATCKACNSRVNSNRDVWSAYFATLARFRELGKDVTHLIGRKVIAQHQGFVRIDWE